MKDVKQCSISSVAFTLEIDAYETLHNYIESIRLRYAHDEDGEEILSDIEARIAELILAVHSAERVVAKPLIDNIIKQMGSVDDICADATAGGEEQEQQEPTPKEQPREKIKRRLYRNMDDAPIGGVCSGVAAFVGCDATIVRIIALLLVIFGGSSIWVYLILWIIMPAAITARQKLEMRGEPITVASIKDLYTSMTQSENNRSFISRFTTSLGQLLMILFKIFMFLILIALIIALIATTVGLYSIIACWSTFGGLSDMAVAVLALVSIIVFVCLAIYVVLQLMNSREIKGKVIVSTVIIWLILSLISAIVVGWSGKGLTERVQELQPLNQAGKFSITVDDFCDEQQEPASDKMEILQELEEIYYESISSSM